MPVPFDDAEWANQRDRIIGLGERSVHKSHYPALRRNSTELKNLAAAVEQAVTGIIIVDREEVVVFANSAAQTVTGYVGNTLLGKRLDILRALDDPDSRHNEIHAAFLSGETWRGETPFKQENGERSWGRLTLAPIRDESGVLTHFAVILEDVTEHRAAEAEIRRLNAELEERVQERTRDLQTALDDLRRTQDELIRAEKLAGLGALVAGVAHEINTPLGNSVTVASSMGEAIKRFSHVFETEDLHRATLVDFLDDLTTGVELLNGNLTRAADLIGKFKRVAVDQTCDKRRRFDCRAVTEEVLTTLEPFTKRAAIVFDIDIPRGIVVDSYPGAYGQIITNLITNAVVHGFNGRSGGRVRVAIAPLPGWEEPWVRLSFADDGAGIPAENLPHVFDPFFTTKFGEGGSGLGLYIVYTLVTRVLRGTVTVSASPGAGVAFTIDFPINAPAEGDPVLTKPSTG